MDNNGIEGFRQAVNPRASLEVLHCTTITTGLGRPCLVWTNTQQLNHYHLPCSRICILDSDSLILLGRRTRAANFC